ncbi:MAG: dimethylamine---corrinoid protein Co-methyltransferase [Methanolobus sp.]|nr:dimethylamine---corrinoid protein Co-methyltransferase [Methanolobus sp.]
MSKIHTRMGDGRRVEMTREEIKAEIEDGNNNAATKGKVPSLTDDELDHLADIFTTPERFVSVNPEDLVVMSTDVAPDTIFMNYSEYGGVGVPTDTVTAQMIAERVCGSDCVQNAFRGGNLKGTSVSIMQVRQDIEALAMNTIAPIIYTTMPNMGAYFKPDGPFDNCGDLMAAGKIKEGQETYEAIVPSIVKDAMYISEMVTSIGADCINLDTAAAAGDAEFQAVLEATEKITKELGLPVLINMSNHFVMGMHGEVEYNGKRLAGMMPHDQAKVVEESGASVYGPVVNTNTKKSVAWNVAKAAAVMKECGKQSNLPIHPNLGMGVCGAPMAEIPPIDAVSRAAKALVEVGRVDGF